MKLHSSLKSSFHITILVKYLSIPKNTCRLLKDRGKDTINFKMKFWEYFHFFLSTEKMASWEVKIIFNTSSARLHYAQYF